MFILDNQTVYKLIVNQGPSPGEEFLLVAAEMAIGREGAVDIVIPAPAVSRVHARLIQRGDGYWIEDSGSSNGTFLNGQPLTDRVRLNPGDKIGLGQSIVLTYTLELPASKPSSAASDPYQTSAIPGQVMEAAPSPPAAR